MATTRANHDLIDLDAVYRWQTKAAWLLDFGNNNEVWIPKSQCEVDCSPNRHAYLRRGDDVTVTMPEWLAIEKGIV